MWKCGSGNVWFKEVEGGREGRDTWGFVLRCMESLLPWEKTMINKRGRGWRCKENM